MYVVCMYMYIKILHVIFKMTLQRNRWTTPNLGQGDEWSGGTGASFDLYARLKF
jgi:hypothetical protein